MGKRTQLQLNFEGPTPQELKTPLELFNEADEALLRSLTEDRRFEMKPNSYSGKNIGDYICMWANTSPHGGVIAIGIRSDTNFEGCCSLPPKSHNEIEKAASTYCPDAVTTSKRVEIHRDSDGHLDFVVLIHVEYHKKRAIKTVEGKVYVRIGDSKKELKTPDEIRRLQADKGEISFEAEPSAFAYPMEFDTASIADFVNGVRKRKQWDSGHSIEDVLSLLHLGSIEAGEFIPNVACALLFAKDPRKKFPGCRIRFLRFQGEHEGTGEKWNAVKDEFLDGTVPQQIQQAEGMIRAQLRNFSRLGPGNKFFTSTEYPETAWYEAIVNACVHRSYVNGLGNMNIFVKMFDDRLVIESPGPFPPLVTPDNIYDVHFPRNPFLMEAMYHLAYVKCAHEGTRRIRDTMQEMALPDPEFKQDEVGCAIVRVTLRNNIHQRRVWVDADVANLLGAQIAHDLNEDEKRCINFVAEWGKISVSEAQRLTKLSWPAARKLLGRLLKLKILEHEHKKDVARDPGARFRLRDYNQK